MMIPGTYERCLAGGHYYAVVRGDEECPTCAKIAALTAELEAARAERDHLREALEAVEWASFPGTCPACGKGKRRGHAPDCPVGRAMGGKR